jgi:hypothetical protein
MTLSFTESHHPKNQVVRQSPGRSGDSLDFVQEISGFYQKKRPALRTFEESGSGRGMFAVQE